jgi:hypothetical protein
MYVCHSFWGGKKKLILKGKLNEPLLDVLTVTSFSASLLQKTSGHGSSMPSHVKAKSHERKCGVWNKNFVLYFESNFGFRKIVCLLRN